MPIFEFYCDKCDKEFETLVFGKEKAVCPGCQTKDVKKLLSAASHKSGGEFTSAHGSGCGSCTSASCGSCGR